MLPDYVLLEIFDFWRKSLPGYLKDWHLLVHVCQRWRQIVFASPLRLNLQILCTKSTPVRTHLGIWPAIPIIIHYIGMAPHDEDNLVAALEHPDRVCQLLLFTLGPSLEKVVTVMQGPFPVLTCLQIGSRFGKAPPVFPAKFLGGSAPCLQEFYLDSISFPALPTLLLSASGLVVVHLLYIPPTGYISPEVMTMVLAGLAKLCTFHFGFQLATSRPDQIRPPPITRTGLPVLTDFEFRGATEYLEDFIARIDCPQLSRISIIYQNELVDSQVARLFKFVDRSVGPEITQFRRARVTFSDYQVTFTLYPHTNHQGRDRCSVGTTISCEAIDWEAFYAAQALSQFSATFSTLVHLELVVQFEAGYELEGTDDVVWLHLLHQFPTVQTLHVSSELAELIALALEGITGDMVTEVLPSLDLICLDGKPASSIRIFLAVRQLSGRPVTVVDTKTEFDQRLESYVSK